MKKTYMTPSLEEITIGNQIALLSGSGIIGDGTGSDIGYGGIDPGDGTVDPDAPPFILLPEDVLPMSF